MNWKQNKGFVAGLALLGTLMAGLSVYAFLTSSARQDVESSFQAKLSERQSLENAKIFPSMENVRGLAGEVTALEGFLATLREDVRRRQTAPLNFGNPSEFNLRLESERNALLTNAASARVELPGLEGEPVQVRAVTISDKFWFDFDEYGLGGKTPEPEKIPALSVQLLTLKAVCDALIRAGVSELGPVEREKLEAAAPAPAVPAEEPEEASTRRRKKGKDQEDGESTAESVESFTCGVRFTARENVVWGALSAIANLPIPLVITGVEVHNLNNALQPSFGGGPAAQVNAGSSGLEALAQALGGNRPAAGARLETAGTEQVQIQLRLRVHQLAAPAPATAPAEPKPQGS